MAQNETHAGVALIAHLPEETLAWQALLDILSEEEAALVAGKADRLAELNTAKLTQLQTLSALAQARYKGLQTCELSPDLAGMQTLLNQQGNTEDHTRWNLMQAMQIEAQSMNVRIGSLIDLRLNATRQAVNVLIHSTTHQAGLYDQAGLSVASRNGKPLTAA